MPFLGEIAALTAALLWGSCAIMFEAAGKRIGPFQTNLLRILFAVFLLCGTLLLQTGSLYPVETTRDENIWLGMSGVVGLAIGDGALFYCLVILGPRLATLLLSLAPAIATILAWIFLGEKLSHIAVAGIVLTVTGIFWVVNEKGSGEKPRGSKWRGVFLGLIAAAGQGIGVILSKRGLAGDIDALSATVLRIVPAAVVLWTFALLTGQIKKTRWAFHDKNAILATVGGTIFGPFLGVWLSTVAVKYTEAGIAATLLATVPILILPMVLITHKSRPSLRAIVGTTIAVGGIALIFLR